MKMVASTMPGVAKMILISCSRSQGPNQPCAPNSSTNTRPATTGEIENGRSMKVRRRLLPGKRNLVIAQAAAMPKAAFSGSTQAATVRVSRIADHASGLARD